MHRIRPLVLATLLALVAASCGDDDAATDTTTDDEVVEDAGTDVGSGDEGTEGTDEGAEDGDEGADPGNGAGDAVGTATTSDGSTWEFADVLECEIGEDGSPDYRQFIGRTADGSAQLDIAYFPEPELAALSGVGIDAEVDGNDWTYSSTYSGGEGEFGISLRPDGADGSAAARVVGIGAPNADLTIDWSFTC